jgi:hypothetical protein
VAYTNAYEKEIETVLRDANTIINRQKEALDKSKDQTSMKDKLKELENQHTKDKKDS